MTAPILRVTADKRRLKILRNLYMEEGAIFGAWDFISRYCQSELLEKLFTMHKRGKFLDKLLKGSFSGTKDSTKFQCHLSRRKYNFLCNIQKRCYDEGEIVKSTLLRAEVLCVQICFETILHFTRSCR